LSFCTFFSTTVAVHHSSWCKKSFLLTIVILGIMVSGCFPGGSQTVSYPPPIPNGPTGGIAMKALLAANPSDARSITRVTATAKRGNQELQQDLVIDPINMMASGNIPRLLIGTWQIRVDVYNDQGELLYTGVTSVLIEEGRTTGVELPLVAAPGKLIMRLEVGDFDSYELIKGKVIIGAGSQPEVVQEFVKEAATEVLVTIDELAPRSHDLRVEVYKNTLHSYNCIYRGPWEVITIQTGRTTEVYWSPAWGCIEIIGIIDSPPPPPSDVSASLQDDGILASWSDVRPIEDDLEAYRLYAQLDPFSGFQLIATVPKNVTSYLYRSESFSCSDCTTMSIQIAISSVDIGGNESERSDPVTVFWMVDGDEKG
jgi:hypothetical protein